jgi:Bacterial Ig domain
MFAQRVSKVWFVSVVAGFFLLGVPGTAGAAAPECTAEPALYQLPAGLTWLNPRAPCTDADGDAITIEVVDAPDFGTLSPDGTQPIEVERMYTANAAAAGNRDTMKFVAVANGERSGEFQVDVWILPAHSAPVCKDLAVSVQAGSSVAIAPDCVDADGDSFALNVRNAPKHGTYDPARRTYTAAPRFAGEDSMTYTVVDAWRLAAAERKVTITVKSAPGQPANASDKTAPTLGLRAKARLKSRSALRRGIRMTATASEPGRVVVEAHVTAKVARSLGIETRVGSLARDLSTGKNTFKLRLDRAARSRLATLRRVRLRLVARMVDAAGNLRTKRLVVTLKK